jgi:protein involved in polysaccharide export with SLBB domain
VIERAGGLTEQAYPLGAVFTRRSSAITEGEANQREARELQNALATAIQRGSITSSVPQNASVPSNATYGTAGVQPAVLPTGSGATNSDVISNLIFELRTTPALGRITITADPSILQVHPELDVVVEGGDTLYIPKRPSTVTVTGEVLNAGSFTYRNDSTVQDYVSMAGGVRDSADEGKIFIVLPDGSARPVEESWLTFSHNNIIPPGSTIVVPRDVAPFNFLTTFANITQITSSIALTAAALAILAKQ